ncbi:hypothetical protein DPMN_010773 [Dreissena polymorpha]|uniref:Uncharacterized protein n=1 Tax=Dreissena polymorpha TaxID=45954 RepID=A0A9D4N0I4_DREPO|nr:hypothetical protein DPMN_010773 [Dreissena polymorpha]
MCLNPERVLISDVKKVLDNRPIQIKKKEVTVQIYVPKKLSTIIVRGPSDIMKEENEETFEMYFENEKKSGGGNIETIDFQAKENAFYITFTVEDGMCQDVTSIF